MGRKEKQAELLIMFGDLISPLEELVKLSENQTEQSRSKACAKFTHDRTAFLNILTAFTKGESGHDYAVESSQITGRINQFANSLVSFRGDTDKLKDELKDIRDRVTRNILVIPCELESAVLEAKSPFSTFMKIRSLCETANEKLVFVDPYIGKEVVRRYFTGISEHVTVTVITKFRRGGEAFGEFIDLSKLYSDERGPIKYCLKYHPSLHDRYLQCDNTVYHLGGSFRDAGQESGFTITKIGGSHDGVAQIDRMLADSAEQYGPSKQNHPLA